MKKTSRISVPITGILLLLSLNFYNEFYYLTPMLFIASLFISIVKKKKISVNINMVFIFLFCLFYYFCNPENSIITVKSVTYDFLYFMGYVSGYLLINKSDLDYKVVYEKYIFVMVTGTTLHGLLNTIINVQTFGLYINSRVLPDYWTGEPWAATGQATLFIFLIGFSYYSLFVKKRNKMYVQIFTLLGVILAIFYNLYTASRTIFIILLVVYAISFIANIFLNNNKSKLRYIIPMISVIIILTLIYYSNMFGLRQFVDGMPLIGRLQSSTSTSIYDDERFNKLSFALSNFWQYPFGGLNFRSQIGYIHNLWLDAYDVAGIIPFVFLSLYTAYIIYNAIFIIRMKKIESNFKILIMGIYLSFFIQFMVEPILDGVPWLFILFCIVTGMSDRYIKNCKTKVIKQKGEEYEHTLVSQYSTS